MNRILSVTLILFMLAPWASPLANASASGDDSCPINPGHVCTHGDACPTQMNQDSGHEHHVMNHGAGHVVSHAPDDGVRVASEGRHHDKGPEAKPHACLVVYECGDDKGPIGIHAPVIEADYATTRVSYELYEYPEPLSISKDTLYQDPQLSLIYRPPASI